MPLPAAPLTVLAVDDDDINLMIWTDMLQQLGVANVHVAADGRQALGLLKTLEPPPDFIIIDLYMPEADGIEVINALAERCYPGGVIMVSGVSVETLAVARQIADAAGLQVAATFIKPLRKNDLAVALGLS